MRQSESIPVLPKCLIRGAKVHHLKHIDIPCGKYL